MFISTVHNIKFVVFVVGGGGGGGGGGGEGGNKTYSNTVTLSHWLHSSMWWGWWWWWGWQYRHSVSLASLFDVVVFWRRQNIHSAIKRQQ